MTDQEYIQMGARTRATQLSHELARVLREFDEDGTFPSVETVDDIISTANSLREAVLKFNTTPVYK